jgi:hypothetical protein
MVLLYSPMIFLERQAAIAALKNHHSNTIPTN